MSYIELNSSQYNETTGGIDNVTIRFTVIDYILCECGKNFDTIELLNEHLKDSKESVCAEKLIKEFQCMLCTKTMSTFRACKHHLKLKHHGPQTKHKRGKNRDIPKKPVHVCSICNKSFVAHENLIIHYRSHTGEKPYQCPLCPKAFAAQNFLRNHIKVHTREQPYECKICHRKFSNKSNELRHALVHTGERPFACDICGKTYQQLVGLKQHKQTVHDKIPLKPRIRVNKKKRIPIRVPLENVVMSEDDSD